MKVKFNKFERVAGIFVVVAISGALLLTIVTAVKKGWFQTKVQYTTQVKSADGLRPGTVVTISGIRAGEVTDVELLEADNIIVHFEIFEKFQKQIKTDSIVQIVRPFVIGDKALEVTVGSADAEVLQNFATIPSQMAFDMMDLISGKKLGPLLGTLEGLMANMSTLAKAFADPKRTEAFVKMFDRMDPLFVNLSKMSIEVTNLTRELNQFLPQIRKESPQVGRDISQLVRQLNSLTAALEPAVKEVGPDLPRASRRALEALDEAVVTLKAIQKSFILSGKVQDVKEEEKREQKRQPASP
jgi:phospholipid/cholesterol/gamma-HCH transport system substrate-binding protein